MEVTTCVFMTKRHLEKYIELLDCRIESLRFKKDMSDEELFMYISMRNHAYNALEVFR